jgi:uncharacterized protein
MQRRYFISIVTIIIWAVLLGGTLNAQKAFLWKVEKGKENCYLLGSIHLLKKEHWPLKKIIEDSFAKCDSLAVEADVRPEKAGNSAGLIFQKGMYQGDETLESNMSKKNFRLVKEKLEKMGMVIDGYQKFKPWFVAMTVMSQQLVKVGFDPRYGVDLNFLNKADQRKIDVIELESVEFQLKLFDGFSKEEQEGFLLSTVLEADKMPEMIGQIIDAWLDGDVDKLGSVFNSGVDDYPELKEMYKKLNDTRNFGMAKKIVNIMKQGKTCFVVVGAAHMIGKNGLVQLLKDKGYRVKQL